MNKDEVITDKYINVVVRQCDVCQAGCQRSRKQLSIHIEAGALGEAREGLLFPF